MEHKELTGKILGAAFAVSNDLGCGFLEKVYERALLIALREKGLEAESQVPISVQYRGKCVGEYFADIVVNREVILEIKAVSELRPEHVAQILNYLRATGMPLGLLINFGKARMQYRRFENRFRGGGVLSNRDEGGGA